MSMRVNTLYTYLQPEDVHTLIEFLDQLRDMLMVTYGDEIMAMLQDASLSPSTRELLDIDADDVPF